MQGSKSHLGCECRRGFEVNSTFDDGVSMGNQGEEEPLGMAYDEDWDWGIVWQSHDLKQDSLFDGVDGEWSFWGDGDFKAAFSLVGVSYVEETVVGCWLEGEPILLKEGVYGDGSFPGWHIADEFA